MTARITPRITAALLAAAISGFVSAQNANFEPDAPWVEKPQAPPEAFATDTLIPVDNPARSNLSFGVVPETLSVGEDGVIRYVLVAKSLSGAMNVQYEGIRCADRTVKIYANWRAGDGWRDRRNTEWTEWRLAPGRYVLRMGRDALCNVQIVFRPPALLIERLAAAAPLR